MSELAHREEFRIGIIGGGALPLRWNLPFSRMPISTPFGEPSSPVTKTAVNETNTVYSILRHGEGHSAGRRINYLANVAALRQLNCDVVMSICLAGTLVDRFDVGDAVIYDDVIDFRKTTCSFYEQTQAVHCSMAPLVAPVLWGQLKSISLMNGIECGGTMAVIEGPRFSTRAESRMLAQWGAELICQTISPECFLVREQQMDWFGMCLVTDRDTWDQDHPVSTELIFKNLRIHEDAFASQVLSILRGLSHYERTADAQRDIVPVENLRGYPESEEVGGD